MAQKPSKIGKETNKLVLRERRAVLADRSNEATAALAAATEQAQKWAREGFPVDDVRIAPGNQQKGPRISLRQTRKAKK